MLFEDIVTGALELHGEQASPLIVGSGRWSDKELERAVNSSIGYIFDVMDEETEIETFNTVAANEIYSLSAAFRTSSFVTINGMRIPKVDITTVDLTTEISTMPTQYSISAAGSGGGYSITLLPIPDKAYPVEVVYSGFTRLVTGSIIPLPDIYEDVMIYGAAAHMGRKFVVNKNTNANEFEMERDSLLNQITIANSNKNVAGLWSHG